MTDTEYMERVEEFLGSRGSMRFSSLGQLVEAWDRLVEQVEEGYDDNIYEYTNNLFVRDLIDQAIADPILKRFPQVRALRERVAPIDERFRAATQDGVDMGSDDDPWWRRRVARRAGAEFADDIKSLYGVDVDVVD
jgi:hypothetical protein